MLKCLIALTSLLSAAAVAAPAWTWVDEQGRRHYSDTPVEGATQIEISGTQTFPGGAASPTQGRSTSASQQEAAFTYSVLDVVSPEEEQTLSNIGGELTVELATYPQLQSNHRIDAILDGERLGLGVRSLTLTIPNVYRGEHTLQLVIVDSEGNDLKQSMPRTFFVRQTSIQNPQRPR